MPFKHNTPTPAELVAFLAPPSPALSRNNIESASFLAKGRSEVVKGREKWPWWLF
jgi:hypothetical protein